MSDENKKVFVEVGKFFPTTGTEGMEFEDIYCSHCSLEENCKLVLLAMCEKDEIEEWIIISNESNQSAYYCTNFKTENNNHPMKNIEIKESKNE